MNGIAYRIAVSGAEGPFDISGESNSRRLFYFVCVSLLIHIIILRQILQHGISVDISFPRREDSTLSVVIASSKPVPQPIDTTSRVVEPDDIQTLPRDISANSTELPVESETPQVVPEPASGIPEQLAVEQQEQKHTPDMKTILETTARIVEITADEMESLVDPKAFMPGSFRQKLEQARREHLSGTGTGVDGTERIYYVNQMGDMVEQTGDTCATVPGLLVPYTFKEGNSILAISEPCQDRDSDSVLAVKRMMEQFR